MDYQLDVDDVTRPWALDYEIDKKYYQDVFYDNIRPGVNNDPCRHDQFWHWSCQEKRELYYFHMMCFEGTDMKNEVNKVSKDLNLQGLETYPRFNYQFPNTCLGWHIDDQNSGVTINLNLQDTVPIIWLGKDRIQHKYPFEALFVNVEKIWHTVKPDPNHRLILKIMVQESWDVVFNRLNEAGLLIPVQPTESLPFVDESDK
mgnify:CR=1 FL=1